MTHSIVKVEENQMVALFKNPERKEYHLYSVDGCVVTEGSRCDYLVSEVGGASVFVELKGKDVAHACEQLHATISNPVIKDLRENKVGFLVVCSKYPRFDSFVARAKTQFAKKYKAGFHVVTKRVEVDIHVVAAIDGRI
ncbi:hypothetical protein [Bosea sp. (in: a-proteobacteria)]|uniref:hypothetical protein n=1 Tax=Bosea sp. (in: a-proteobacteria) TaxID=1871050 RepID=UPI0011F5A564|nr:hypothetical protein [Bosea sp. (in: a-proteobacteria)]TAJ34808.1 MAG: hypothetical protein EPO59_00965 [Bosea sp. (in: a-proteobacteria)]